ncbi:hypothetical protein AGMMS50239_38170 [Bacteroidia bacterium]|nr:hypothetical protein AGMMS50239_38170 [Bacteroidia bacterium]
MVIILSCFSALGKCYKRYNQNILFLLNALENGDYSFHFSETKLSPREKEMNQLMNRIKDILANARKAVIENEHFLSLIIESVSTGIVIINDRGIVQRVNQSALDMFGLPVFSHVNQLHTINETYPRLFLDLQAGDSIQLSLPTEREELSISLHVSQIRLKRGMMRIITLNNIGNELEMKEMESWIRLIRVMTHEIMNSIAPITSLSETMHFLHRDGHINPEDLKQNTLEAFDTIHTTASGLLSFVDSYRKFTAVPKPEKRDFNLNVLIDKVIKLHHITPRKRLRAVVRWHIRSVMRHLCEEMLGHKPHNHEIKQQTAERDSDEGEDFLLRQKVGDKHIQIQIEIGEQKQITHNKKPRMPRNRRHHIRIVDNRRGNKDNPPN